MDVELVMKSAVLAIACLAVAPSVLAQNVQVFGTDINVHENCDLVVGYKGKQPEHLKLPFSSMVKCRLMPNSQTNIPRLEFFEGEYVLLVQSMIITTETCRAELAAITINRDGSVRLSPKTPGTAGCEYNERKSFEILRNHSPKRP